MRRAVTYRVGEAASFLSYGYAGRPIHADIIAMHWRYGGRHFMIDAPMPSPLLA